MNNINNPSNILSPLNPASPLYVFKSTTQTQTPTVQSSQMSFTEQFILIGFIGILIAILVAVIYLIFKGD